MVEEITKLLKIASEKAGIIDPAIHLEHPEDINHGDFSSNVAMVHAKTLKVNPKVLAEKIVEEFNNLVSDSDAKENILSAVVAGPGFINFKIADSFFINKIVEISKDKKALENFGKIKIDSEKKIMVEYTDPNPFKVFHIGHLMANTIGESLSRLIEFSGAEVIRACYQGDVGLHVAKTIWGILNSTDSIEIKRKIFSDINLIEKINCMGQAYVFGNEVYEGTDTVRKQSIIDVNKKIYELRNIKLDDIVDEKDKEIKNIYDAGLKLSLEYFNTIYVQLGTNFDIFFLESEVASKGLEIVREFYRDGDYNTKKIFQDGDGGKSIVYKADVVTGNSKLHTRVFINSDGLPTYEAKELGLTKKKFELYYNLEKSVVVTASEQDAYFQVILSALDMIYPEIASKCKHISHGILRPSTGKMSSRKGNVIPAEVLIKEFEVLVQDKIMDRDFNQSGKKEISNLVAVAGLKYVILRQAIGGDIIYDPTKALSFEGDSGPYLQYATVRASAVVSKAQQANIPETISEKPEKSDLLEKLLLRFPEVIEHARAEYAPHYIVTYLTELASTFNSYYANNQIIDEKNALSAYRVSLVKVFVQTMKNGLWVLGIKVPERM